MNLEEKEEKEEQEEEEKEEREEACCSLGRWYLLTTKSNQKTMPKIGSDARVALFKGGLSLFFKFNLNQARSVTCFGKGERESGLWWRMIQITKEACENDQMPLKGHFPVLGNGLGKFAEREREREKFTMIRLLFRLVHYETKDAKCLNRKNN